MATTKLCSIEGCGNKNFTRNLCSTHYRRKRMDGSLPRLITKKGEGRRFIEEVAMIHNSKECLRFPFINSNGYGQIAINNVDWTAHSYVCHLANGDKPENTECAHNCGNSWCVNPGHLQWKSKKENIADKWSHGTMTKGEKVKNSKITEKEVLLIREMGELMTHKEISLIFGVSKSTISHILSRRNWGWLT